jgi:hypothetical protein
MPVYHTVNTTPRLDELIHDVATSIAGENDGEVKVSANGGEVFVYKLNNESIALGKEYFEKGVSA